MYSVPRYCVLKYGYEPMDTGDQEFVKGQYLIMGPVL